MKGDLPLRDYERFSAYLDGQLPPAEKARLEKDLKARPDLRLALEEISATRQVLRKASRYRAPRNFTLSPEVARQATRRALFPVIGFRFSTALAALAFVAVMVLQVLPGGLAQNAMTMQAASAPQAQPLTAAPLATYSKSVAANQPTGQPDIIQWGASGGSGGGNDAAAVKSSGIGGGPQTSPNNGIVTYNGIAPENPAAALPNLNNNSVSIPSEAAAGQPTPTAEAATLPQATQTASADRALEAGGPVLGLPEQDTAGKVIDQSPANGEPALATQAQATAAIQQTEGGFVLTERQIAQVILLAVALLAAVAALALRRKG